MEKEAINYKLSNYNFEFPYPQKNDAPEQMVMYNARTGSLALIEKEKYAAYQALVENGKPIEDEELLSNLRMGGYIVDDGLDELTMLRYYMMRDRFCDNSMGLTIAPTSDCNFRCVYCYEKDSIKPVTMSMEIQDALVDFIKKRISMIRSIHIQWYGGEPLLAIDIVEGLSHRIMELCEEQRVNYSAGIVTNGYLLSPAIMDRLNAIKVDSWQVTLDGAAVDHDQRRFLKGGHPTFDRIIENLVAIKDKVNGRIAIRINADKHNIDRVDNVIHILKENDLMGITAPYLAMVENLNSTYNDNSCLHTNEFSQLEFDFIQRNDLDFISKIPRQISNYCCADNNNSFVIGADGLIYKCWNDIGVHERSIGSLKTGIPETMAQCANQLYDATVDPECKNCRYLPLCMGGCSHLRKYNPDLRCTEMKHGLTAFMSVIPSILEKQLDESRNNETGDKKLD